MVEVKVPEVGESISEVQIGQWLKSEGEWVAAGEDLVDIETEKASVQIPSPESGFRPKISPTSVTSSLKLSRRKSQPAGRRSNRQRPAAHQPAARQHRPR